MENLDLEFSTVFLTFFIPFVLLGVGFYFFIAFCMAKMAAKLGFPFGSSFVMALIPLVNIILMLQMAAKPMWWILLMLIPLVNLVISIIVWIAIAERRGKPAWWGAILIVPVVGFVFFLLLAFSESQQAVVVKPVG